MCKSKESIEKKRNETYRRKMSSNLRNGSQSRGSQHPKKKEERKEGTEFR